MTDDRSLERAARSWLEAGPTEAPDRAVEAALLQIETTPQERDLRIPRRLPNMTTPARVAAAAVIGVLAIGGAFFFTNRPQQPAVAGPPSAAPSAAPTSSATPAASASKALDYSSLQGRILIEHLGNAIDGSEASTTGEHPRRLYLGSPSDMTRTGLREFLPDQPIGKISVDVSPDGKRVVFQDTSDQARIWEAGIDGTGTHKLETTCNCIEGDPAYDPTGTKIVFSHIEGANSWLAIRDLTSGAVTRLEGTVGPSADAVPEQASWSPDGTRIVFSRMTWNATDRPASGKLSIVDVATGVVTDLAPHLAEIQILPGEPDWSPDGSTIVFTDGPLATTGGVPDLLHGVYVVNPDGTGLRQLTFDLGSGAASWTPDGTHILYFMNYFWLMNPDGSDQRPVQSRGMDLSEDEVGYSYIGHWVDNP